MLFLTEYIIQRRIPGANPLNYFDKRFDEFRNGFGANGELWLGLEKIHQLTLAGRWIMEVHLTDWNGHKKFARYNSFKLGPGPRYILTV